MTDSDKGARKLPLDVPSISGGVDVSDYKSRLSLVVSYYAMVSVKGVNHEVEYISPNKSFPRIHVVPLFFGSGRCTINVNFDIDSCV